MSQTEKIDILDRTKIMSDIEQILVLLSEQKQGQYLRLMVSGVWQNIYTGTVRKKLVGLQRRNE